jgi:hypothetical protein
MTDVGTTKRKAMTNTRRLRIFESTQGVCVLCDRPIDGVREKWTVEHIRALGLGGIDDDKNCGPAHEDCRRGKDRTDVVSIAKAKRQKARHVGIKQPVGSIKGKPFPQSPAKEKAPQRASLPPRSLYVRKP